MDQESLDYGMGVLDEIDGAVRPIGMELVKQDPDRTGGIPCGEIRFAGGGPFAITCRVVPTHRDGVSTTFVQLELQLTSPTPEHRADLERYAQGSNAQFQMGTLVVAGDALWMKYVAVLEPAIALEEAHMQAAVFAFCQQAEVLARRGQAICRGELTVEDALAGKDQ